MERDFSFLGQIEFRKGYGDKKKTPVPQVPFGQPLEVPPDRKPESQKLHIKKTGK